jgi:hypothetical protein
MHTVVEHNVSSGNVKSNVPENWKKNAKNDAITYYNDDDMINAFLQGKIYERKEQQKILYKTFKSNFEKVTKSCENILEYIRELSIEAQSINLKIDSITNFDAIVLVSKKDYMSSKFSEVYSEAIRIRKNLSESDIHLFFNFMAITENLSVDLMALDGYNLTYTDGKNKRKRKTSRTREAHGESK